jgi:predicted dehydrogenase
MAYSQINQDKGSIAAVMEYGAEDIDADPAKELTGRLELMIEPLARPESRSAPLRLAVVGAGSFARSVHLPQLKRDSRVDLKVIVTRSPLGARTVAKANRVPICTTDWEVAVRDPDIDAVMITTRHNLHAEQTLAALEAGKQVFVEKPMAITVKDCERIVRKQGEHVLIVGFNRRFSPAVQYVKAAFERLNGPKNVLMRVNAGRLDSSNWVYGSEGGGRIIGEGCHFFDLVRWLVGEEPRYVTAAHTRMGLSAAEDRDNLSAVIEFSDGSIATLVYITSGSSRHGKERLEVHADGTSIVLDDYTQVTAAGLADSKPFRARKADKGHNAIVDHFIQAASGYVAPLLDARDGWWAQRLASAALLSAEKREPVDLAGG